jgi:hypothetical protein
MSTLWDYMSYEAPVASTAFNSLGVKYKRRFREMQRMGLLTVYGTSVKREQRRINRRGTTCSTDSTYLGLHRSHRNHCTSTRYLGTMSKGNFFHFIKEATVFLAFW